ncbi:hypothetical protein F5888DRAFT_1607397 [Russula emetica]|nr:hypothetical protein F5888DRAFT_1607397 [Russula emetica]
MIPLHNIHSHHAHTSTPFSLWKCKFSGCNCSFKNRAGLKSHIRLVHSSARAGPSQQHPPHTPNTRHNLQPLTAPLSPSFPPLSPLSSSSSESESDPDMSPPTHPYLSGKPCDKDGNYLPPDTPPPPQYTERSTDDWTPYRSRVEFEVAEFLYMRNQMSGGHIDDLLSWWAATLVEHGARPPFKSHGNLYSTIDATPLGDCPWQSFTLEYNGDRPENNVPSWMTSKYDVWFRSPCKLLENMVSNPDFDGEFDVTPLQEHDMAGNHRFQNFMSGNWSWKQADIIAEDPITHGSMFVPIILGSDKTTVSVGTGNNEYWPVYMSIGNIHNNVRRAHRNGVVLLGFLAIPKTKREYSSNIDFRKYRRQLFHSSLARILEPLKTGMTTPKVLRCPDGHYRRVIYGLGPYIADYPEQALLACIVQGWCAKCTASSKNLDGGVSIRRCREHTDVLVEEEELGILWDKYGLVGDVVPFTNYFPRADIHELLSPDILHQLIKGTFKDHLVTWVEQYLIAKDGKARAKEILDDIDQRIAAVPPFSNLRRFPEGRGFKQWTGDDSKALMKVYLPAIEGHVPQAMVRALQAFLEFCYIARHDVQDTKTLAALEDALVRFHNFRSIFQECGVRADGFNLPRQHSLMHYLALIRAFGAPNGLCSSITESKHIKAVKEPWRRSSRFEAMGQMLVTNQRLDKLAASRVDFASRGMLKGTCLSQMLYKFGAHNTASSNNTLNNPTAGGNVQAQADDDDDEGDVAGPRVLANVTLAKTIQRRVAPNILAAEIDQSNFLELIRRFLYRQLRSDSDHSLLSDSDASSDLNNLPEFHGKVAIYTSAVATYYAPSDLSGVGGMHRERIRAVSKWRNGPARYDCVYVSTDPEAEGMRGLDIARVRLFFEFSFKGIKYPCALIQWFSRVADGPDEDTGMWIVQPDKDPSGLPIRQIIHLDTIVRAAHLIGVYGDGFLPRDLTFDRSLDVFRAYYVNKFIDHHAFEIAY